MESETNFNDGAQPCFLVRIETVRPFEKNTLRAFVDFELVEIGLLVRGATLHEKDGNRWLSLPTKPYEANGKRGWAPVVEVPHTRTRNRLQNSVLSALDNYQARQQAKSTPLHDAVVSAYDARDERQARGGN